MSDYSFKQNRKRICSVPFLSRVKSLACGQLSTTPVTGPQIKGLVSCNTSAYKGIKKQQSDHITGSLITVYAIMQHSNSLQHGIMDSLQEEKKTAERTRFSKLNCSIWK